jgi:hypothetical protein
MRGIAIASTALAAVPAISLQIDARGTEAGAKERRAETDLVAPACPSIRRGITQCLANADATVDGIAKQGNLAEG